MDKLIGARIVWGENWTIQDIIYPDSKEVIQPVNQRNPIWASKKLGFSSLTLGGYGCLVTSLGMLCGYNPDDMNEKMKALKMFSGALVNSFDVSRINNNVKFLKLMGRYENPVPSADLETIKKHVEKEWAVIEVDISTAPSLQQHFVLATGIKNGNIVINDPWHGDETTLFPRYGSTEAVAIYRAILYSK